MRPVIRGHSGAVSSFQWSPFDDCLLASGSANGEVRLWVVPDDGLDLGSLSPSSQLENSASCAEDRSRVRDLQWHPAAASVLASVHSSAVRVWDAEKSELVCNAAIEGAAEMQALAWAHEGRSLWASSRRDQLLRRVDARTGTIVASTKAHEGSQGVRVVSCQTTDGFLLTSGTTATRQREVRVWDPRRLDKRLSKLSLDASPAPLIPLFDGDTRLLFLGSRGVAGLKYYELDSGGKLHAIGAVSACGEPHIGLSMQPKRTLDVLHCEVARILRLTRESIQPVSVTVPRRVKSKFYPELFPDTASSAPALGVALWRNGTDAAPTRMSLNPDEGNLTPIGECAPVRLVDSRTRGGAGGRAEEPSDVTVAPPLPEPVVGPSGAAEARARPLAAAGTATTSGDGISPRQAIGGAGGAAVSAVTEQSRIAAAAAAEASAVEARAAELATQLGKGVSKFKHVEVRVPVKQKTHFNIRPCASQTDEVPMAVSTAHFAVPVQGAGGRILVRPLNGVGKVADTPPTIAAHAGKVTALAFGPGEPELLASAGDDQIIRLWDVSPSDGVSESCTIETGPIVRELRGHAKAVACIAWHPTADGLLASASGDSSIRLWDSHTGVERLSLDHLHAGHAITWCDWDLDGRTLVTSCRDSFARVLDPRSATVTAEWSPFPKTSRSPRAIALGCSSYVLTTGFGASRNRKYKVWDLRHRSKPVVNVEVDKSSSLLVPHYDADTGLVFFASRGERNVRVVDVGAAWRTGGETAASEGGLGSALPCATLETGAEPVLCLRLTPRRIIDVRNVEVNRLVQLSLSRVSVLPVTVPRAHKLKGYFQDDLYTAAALTGEPAIGIDEWQAGNDSATGAVRKSLRPESMQLLSEKPPEVQKESKSARYLKDVREAEGGSAARAAVFDRMTAMAAAQAAAAGGEQSDSELSGWSDSD